MASTVRGSTGRSTTGMSSIGRRVAPLLLLPCVACAGTRDDSAGCGKCDGGDCSYVGSSNPEDDDWPSAILAARDGWNEAAGAWSCTNAAEAPAPVTLEVVLPEVSLDGFELRRWEGESCAVDPLLEARGSIDITTALEGEPCEGVEYPLTLANFDGWYASTYFDCSGAEVLMNLSDGYAPFGLLDGSDMECGRPQ